VSEGAVPVVRIVRFAIALFSVHPISAMSSVLVLSPTLQPVTRVVTMSKSPRKVAFITPSTSKDTPVLRLAIYAKDDSRN
jgi:hypothetical protein